MCFFCARPIFVLCGKNASRTHPQQTRDRKKALVKRKKPVRVYQRPDVGLKEIKRKGSDLVPRSANYSICLISGGGAMPRGYATAFAVVVGWKKSQITV